MKLPEKSPEEEADIKKLHSKNGYLRERTDRLIDESSDSDDSVQAVEEWDGSIEMINFNAKITEYAKPVEVDLKGNDDSDIVVEHPNPNITATEDKVLIKVKPKVNKGETEAKVKKKMKGKKDLDQSEPSEDEVKFIEEFLTVVM
jgi:hypothetical protein